MMHNNKKFKILLMLLKEIISFSYNENPRKNKITILMQFKWINIKINKEVKYAKLS